MTALGLGVTLWIGWAGFGPTDARADKPLTVSAARKVCSRNGRYCAFMDSSSGTVAYEMKGDAKGAKLWSIPGWFRVAALADDGVHFVAGYDGMNLIPKRYDPKLVMITFYDSGKAFHEVHLDELIEDFSKLHPTVSHLAWGDFPDGLDEHDAFVVTTVEKRTLAFDPKTGKAKSASPSSAPPPPVVSATPAPTASPPTPVSAPSPGTRACNCGLAGPRRGPFGALALFALAAAWALRRRFR
jgi:MYXO-CTERM domain-containing protein